MTRSADELAKALRVRASMLTGASWETPATDAMMNEAAVALDELRDQVALRQLRIDWLEDALRALTEACEHDFCNENTERQCADDSTVAYTEDQDDQLTFGHIRRARQVLDRKDV